MTEARAAGRRVLLRLRSRPGIRGAASIALSTAVAQGVALGISPVLTRMYAPSDFGTLGVYAALLALSTAIASWRYEAAIPLAEDEDSALSLLFLCVLLLLGTVAVVGGMLLLGALVGANLGSNSGLDKYLWLLPIGVLALGLYQSLSYWAIRERAYGVLAVTKLSQGGALAAVQVGIGAISSGPLGLLLGDLAGRGAGVSRLGRLVRRQVADSGRRALGLMGASARRFWRFPVFSSGATLLNVASLNLPPLLMVAIYGPKVGGLFVLAQRVVMLPVTLIGDAVGQVYFGRAAELARSAKVGDLTALFSRASKALLLLALPWAVIVAALGPDLFAAAFGDPWRRAGTFAQLLVAALVTRFVVYPLSQTLNVLELQRRQALWDVIRFVGVLAVFLWAELSELSPESTVAAFSALLVATYLAVFCSARRALRRESP